MVLIQEMALKIDQGFLAALTELFTPSTDPEADQQRVIQRLKTALGSFYSLVFQILYTIVTRYSKYSIYYIYSM